MSLVNVLLNNEGTAHLHTWLQVSSLHMDIHLLSNAVNVSKLHSGQEKTSYYPVIMSEGR